MRANVGKPFVRPYVKENAYNAVSGLVDIDALDDGIFDIGLLAAPPTVKCFRGISSGSVTALRYSTVT